MKTTKLSLESCYPPASNFISNCFGDQLVFMYVICAGPINCFVSVGNRFLTKHLHVSINFFAGYAGVELYSSIFNVLTNTTNFGGESH